MKHDPQRYRVVKQPPDQDDIIVGEYSSFKEAQKAFNAAARRCDGSYALLKRSIDYELLETVS